MTEHQLPAESRLRQIHITVRPAAKFPVPFSDGYSVYAALLSVLETVDTDVSGHIHDSSLGSIHSSGLRGEFGESERAYHKLLLPDETYQLTVGVVDPADTEIFQTLMSALVLEDDPLALSHGQLQVEYFESANTTQAELLEEAGSMNDPTVEIAFETVTCIQDADEVTTRFPHRGAVFSSLVAKWNRSAPDELAFDLNRETIEANVIEKPDADSYATHSVLVNRVENSAGQTENIFRQGFTGGCAYEFKGASESIQNAVAALGMFAEYSGVGSAVARGCGKVNTEVTH